MGSGRHEFQGGLNYRKRKTLSLQVPKVVGDMLTAGLIMLMVACVSPAQEALRAPALTSDESARLEGLQEAAANAEAVRVLVVGWAVNREEAISLMYASLMAGLHRTEPLPGHDTPCRELSVFAQTFNRPQPPCAPPS